MPVYSVTPLRPIEFLQLNLAHLLVTGSAMPVVGPQKSYSYIEKVFVALLQENADKALKVLAWARVKSKSPDSTTVCLYLLAVLCRKKSPYVSWAFHQLVLTLSDLLEFLSICVTLRKGKRPWKNAKELSAHWLELNLTDLDVAIYAKRSGKRTGGVSLKDAVLLTHPIDLSKQKIDFLFNDLTYEQVSGVYRQRLSLKLGNLYSGLPWEVVGPATQYNPEAFKASLQATTTNTALILIPVGMPPFEPLIKRLKTDPDVDPLTLFRACSVDGRASYALKAEMTDVFEEKFRTSTQNNILILLDRSGLAGTVFLQEAYAALRNLGGDIFLYDDVVDRFYGDEFLRARGGWYPTEAIAKVKAKGINLIIMTARAELPDSSFEMLDLHYKGVPVVIVYPENLILKKKYSPLRRAVLGVNFLWSYRPFFQDPFWIVQEIEKWLPSYT